MNPQAKTVGASERDEQARARWRTRVVELDPERLVFVDECGSNVGLTPLHARAPRGERAFGQAPRNRGKNTTLASPGEHDDRGDGTWTGGGERTTKAVFGAYVERVLAPPLRPGEVVMMDNLSAHKGDRTRELIEQRGCELLFLPSYSPDFSPIEEAFSKLKALLRRETARTKEALVEAIGWALVAITPAMRWVGLAIAVTYSLIGRYENRCMIVLSSVRKSRLTCSHSVNRIPFFGEMCDNRGIWKSDNPFL